MQTVDVDLTVNLDSDRHPVVSYIYNSFDLYSQLYDDSSWSGHSPDPTTDSSRKNTGFQVKYNIRNKRKATIEKSRVSSADKFNSYEDKAEHGHVTKHGVIREASSNLHVVAEETETDTKTLSSSNVENTSDTHERSFSSLHGPGVMKQNSCRFLNILVFCLDEHVLHFHKFDKEKENYKD